MKKLTFPILLSGILLFSCGTENENANAEKETTPTTTPTDETVTTKEISYELAKNYFVKNTYTVEKTTAIKITDKNQLDSIFGPATTMAEEGKPTQIDFDTQYVIAVIEPSTENELTLENVSLTQTEEEICVSPKYTEGEKQTFTTKPFVLLIIDKAVQGKVSLGH